MCAALHGAAVRSDGYPDPVGCHKRAIENAYFIQQRRQASPDRKLADILHEFCSYTDGCWMSAKKDALVNIGGWLSLNDDAKFEEARNLVIVYGACIPMAAGGRDMEAMARASRSPVDDDHMRRELVRWNTWARSCSRGITPHRAAHWRACDFS